MLGASGETDDAKEEAVKVNEKRAKAVGAKARKREPIECLSEAQLVDRLARLDGLVVRDLDLAHALAQLVERALSVHRALAVRAAQPRQRALGFDRAVPVRRLLAHLEQQLARVGRALRVVVHLGVVRVHALDLRGDLGGALGGLAPELAPGTLLADNLSALLRYDAFCAGYIGLGESAWLVGTAAVFLALNTWTIRNIRD